MGAEVRKWDRVEVTRGEMEKTSMKLQSHWQFCYVDKDYMAVISLSISPSITSSLSTHLSMDTYAASKSWLL